MKTRRIATVVLSIFVAVSVTYFIATEARKPAKSETAAADTLQKSDNTAPDNSVSVKERALTVYYFHTTFRCPTCRKIESLTASAVQKFFSAELASKKMTWKPVNIEIPENRHFADDFKLFTKSVVIVDSKNGKTVRWKNLDRIWELVRNESAFTGYIKNEIAGYLSGI
jgi:hypothetical protein